MHSYLDIQEPQFSKIDRSYSNTSYCQQNSNDQVSFYILDTCALIVVLNAALNYPSIISIVPDYVFRHYRYLRTKEPDLTPNLHRVGNILNIAFEKRFQITFDRYVLLSRCFKRLDLYTCATIEHVRCRCCTSNDSSIVSRCFRTYSQTF
jgi:hypothetical protein